MKLSHLLFAAVLLLSAAAAPAAQRTFDLRAPAVAPAPAAGEDGAAGSGLLRAAEAPAAAAGELAPGDRVTLLLFDGERVDLEIEEASATTFSGARAFLARTAGSPFRDAVVLVDPDGALHARIQGLGDGRVLRVFPRGGATAVEESEAAPLGPCDCPPAPAAAEPAPAPGAEGAAEAPLPAVTEQSDVIVDVLVGFDLHAKAWAENNGGTTNFAETAVQNMNLALANSNLDGYFRFRLAGVAFVNAWESGVRKAYDRYGTGEWAVMGSAAAACGADVVTVLIDTGGDSGTTGCGKAFTSTSQTSFNAVNVCAIRAVAIGETMTHECGHNLGCGHANTAGASDPGPQSFPYSSGYHFTGSDGEKYHTIMAYNFLDGVSGTFKLANVFSSPDLTIAGVPAGTADANDNRRVLTQTGAWASHWRTAVRPVTYDVFFTPASETAISGSLRVTLEPGRSGLPIRYTTDGSAPTLQSALYSGPITLTGTTTIRAATVCDGALGPVCTARYFVPDLSEALDTPGLAWTTSSYRPFTFQTTNTWDGSDAVQSASNPGSTIEATIVGPTSMSFRYRTFFRTDDYPVGNIAEKLVVLVDNQSVWSASPEGSPSDWLLGEAAIPSGSHTVRFAYQQNGGSVVSLGGRTYGVWLDNVRFDALSRPPALSPATTDSESTAAAFTGGSRTVSISAPGGDGTLIRYTTDGSDPMKDGIPYEGPFTISASTRVRAVAIEAGRDPSVETAGLYLERHRPVRPGEWTADATGLPADAAADSSARLILGLYSTAGMNTACANFRGIVEDPAFTSWCAANGVYLLVSDTTVRPDGALAKPVIVDWANRLESGTPITGPALVAVTPDGATTKAADLTFGSGDAFGSKTYQGTVDSLIACLAALLDKTPPSAPTATPDGELVSGFPVSVSLANPNSSGTIRYTLDGSVPTRASAAWTGSPIQIQAGQVLSAAVFPTDSAGLTSTILRRHYRTIPGFFGIPDDAFDWNAAAGDYPWRQHTLASEPTLRSGNNGADQYGPTYRSVLRAVARAAGTLSFSFGDITYIYNTSVFTAPDGTPTSLKSPTTASIEWKAISVDVEPGDVLLWTRDVTYANLEFEAYDFGSHTAHCGAYLRNLVWTPADQPPVPTAPTIGSVSVSDVTMSGATVSVPVTDLGVDSSSVTVKVVVNGVERTQTLSAPGTATFVCDGLSPDTSYTAAVTATGSNGLSASATASFTTAAAEPPAGTVSVGTPDFASNTATVNVTALGDGAASVAITLEYSTDASFASARTVDLGSVSAPGAKTATLGDLAAGTTYHVRAVLTGAKTTTTAAVSFTTRSYTPPALGAAAATAGKTTATVTVPVSALGDGDEWVDVAVTVNGTTQTQRLTAAGTATLEFASLAYGTGYTATITATGSNGLSASATVAFTTAAAEPPAGTVSVGTPDFASNTATVNVTALGDGAASVAITLEYSTDASFASARTVDLGPVSAPGAKTATLGDLAAGTTYHVRAVLTGAKTTTTAAASFTTRSYTPPALGAVSVTTTKTAATLTVPVTSLGDGGASVTVSATLGGATKTATLSAAGEATFVFDGLTADTEYAWSVSAVAAPTGLAATPQSGVATTQGVQKETKGWFFVDLSDAGYAAFPDVSGVAAPGGTWSGAGEYSATYSAASRTLAIARAENAAADAELRYTPTKPTESGCDAEVRGTIRPNAVSILPAPPSGPLGGVVFLRRGGRAVPHGLADGAWHELSPSVAEGADVAWEAIFDFSSASRPRVRYAIGATTNAWIALASGTKLSAVSFRGAGTLGSFRGAYARVVGSFAKPEFGAASADGSALGFGTDPATGRATFSVTIDNATDDADYAVYVCDTVDGDYVLDAAATQSGAGEVRTFTMVDDASTKFVKIVAAEPGYAFPQRFADIEF